MTTLAWIDFRSAGKGIRGDAEAFVQELRSLGITPCERGAQADGMPGIMLVGEADDSLLAELARTSRAGLDRVLVVASAQCAERDFIWRLLDAGASDVLVREGNASVAREAAARLERWWAVDRLVQSPAVAKNLIGTSRRWLSLLREIVEVAHFSDASILITGESGTGKELIARLIHTLDARPDKRELVVVDCTTVAPELAGSELFGHERGSYTGATGPRDGAFALADGGTLFLDEVGELPLPLQAQLLRAVQERTFKRVGGNTWQASRFRLVSATNRDLSAGVEGGSFRRDLFYRLATWVCHMPPLRERPEDILPLAAHFMEKLCGAQSSGLDPSVRDYLLNREYPGNVRDLKQVVQRICARRVGGGPITVGQICAHERPTQPIDHDWKSGALEEGVRRALRLGAGMEEIGRAAQDLAVQIVVSSEQGNLQRAARRLGVTDRALQKRRAEQRH